jgi:zinc/manganese transport system substrate-binding protein/manganese/iron transport system substrate-binding protein
MAVDAGSTAPVVRLGEGLPPDSYLASADGTGGKVNPHLWLDPELAIGYVERIGEALVAVDPGGADAYRDTAAEARADLVELDAWAASRLAAIPTAERRIVAFHDALPYLARAYDIEVVGVVVDSPGQEPSAGEVATLIEEIRRTGVPAVVSEIQFDDRIAHSIADEAGATVVSDLYTDTLGDPPVDTYDGLIRWVVERLAGAMSGT